MSRDLYVGRVREGAPGAPTLFAFHGTGGDEAQFFDLAREGPAYAFGYSNGANILAATQMAHPHLFARVALLHPLIPWDPAPVALSGVDVLITAGRRDPITPWSESQKLLDWYAEQGARVSKVVHEGGHELRKEEVAALAGVLSEPATA